MSPSLRWSLRPLPTVAQVFHLVLENISNRLLEIVSSTEYEVALDSIRCLVEGAIDILRGASDADILLHFSILNSVIVCTLRHLNLNSHHLDVYGSPQFHHLCHQLDELRQHYFRMLFVNYDISFNLSRLSPIVKESLAALRHAKHDNHVSVQILIGALLCDPLQFPIEDLLSVIYGCKPTGSIIANLFIHLPIFAGLSFVKPTLHMWRADALFKRLHGRKLFASTLQWTYSPLHILLSVVSRGQDDSLLPHFLEPLANANINYLAYLKFTCNRSVLSLSMQLQTPSCIHASLDVIIKMLSEYPILEEPDEYMLLCELISSSGTQAYTVFLGLWQEGSVYHPAANPHAVKKLIVRLRAALVESCHNTMKTVCVQDLVEHLIVTSTKPRDLLMAPAVTIICFALITCYFNLSSDAAVNALALSRDLDLIVVKAIFQFETLILVSLHHCVLDALCNFKEQGRWIELYPIKYDSTHHIQAYRGIKIPISKILRLPLSLPVAEIFKSIAIPSSKQAKMKTTKGRSRMPFLLIHECKFVAVVQGVECELSLFELLVWDLRNLELPQLIDHIRYLWCYSWEEAENEIRRTLQALSKTFHTSDNTLHLSSHDRTPDSGASIVHHMVISRTTDRNHLELVARSELVRAMKHIGSVQFSDLSQLCKYVSNTSHSIALSRLESGALNRVVAWGVENGYFRISGHNPQILYYIN